MEPKLVYSALRKLSEWFLVFYSDIYVGGAENIHPDGPLIIASSHHNEIVDIATLCTTIPYGRQVCFWAKSSLFKNALVRAILNSAGSIPVYRNPNSTPPAEGGASGASGGTEFHQKLFRETFRALDKDRVIGVFPEGTSYTEPQIAQVKDGAAWAALEYWRWCREGKRNTKGSRPVTIVPVGIVYTDKSQYQSRLCLRWGKPIDIQPYAEQYLSNSQSDTRAIVRNLTSEVEKGMRELTINAPDWDTLYAAEMLRDLLWGDERDIPLNKFVEVHQQFIQILSSPNNPMLQPFKKSLLRYYSLLHYTQISHASLSTLAIPRKWMPTGKSALVVFLLELAITFLHPRFSLFFVPMVLHIPAYCAARLGNRFLAQPKERESQAQFKALFGGLGAAGMYIVVGCTMSRAAIAAASVSPSVFRGRNVVIRTTHRLGRWVLCGGALMRGLGVLAIMCGTIWLLAKWHSYFVASNYAQFKRLHTSFKVLAGVRSPPSDDVPPTELAAYTTPPPAYISPLIRSRLATSQVAASERTTPPAVSPRRLIRPMLAARVEAAEALDAYLAERGPGWELMQKTLVLAERRRVSGTDRRK